MKKKFGILIGIILVVGIITWIATDKSPRNDNNEDKPTIVIGATLPLTGDLAFAGVPAQMAIELALEDIKKERDLKYNYELVFLDDHMDKKQAVLNLNRMESVNKINAVMTMWLMSSALSGFTQDKGIIHMGCSWGKQPAKGLYNFNHSSFYEEQTELLVKEMKKRNIKKVGTLSSNTLTDEEIIQYIIPVLKKEDIEVVFNYRINPGTKDFKTEISKMKSKPVDLVLVFMVSPENEIFAKQMKEFDLNIPLSTFDNFAYFPEYFEGQWFVEDASGSNDFKEYFKEETGMKAESCSANLYDGLKVLINGFENAPNLSNKDVAETISKTKEINSVMGKVYMDSEGNIHTQPMLRQIKNDKSVSLKD